MPPLATPPAAGSGLPRFANILRSETCKLLTVRSTYWTLLAALASNVVFAALAAVFLPGQLTTQPGCTAE